MLEPARRFKDLAITPQVAQWGPLSVADWGVLATAAFTALAAGAAWRTVSLDHRRQRLANNPNLSLTLAAVAGQPPHQRMEVASAGPGVAIATAYFGLAGQRKIGGYFAKTTLLPGERSVVLLPPNYFPDGRAELVWWCRDFGGNLHVWSHHGDSKALRPKADQWPSGGELFSTFYATNVPAGDILTFTTE